MDLQGGLTSALPPGSLSPTLDYGVPISPPPPPGGGGGGPGPSHPPSPGRGSSPVGGPAIFNYNQLEGRFKQLQGKTSAPPPPRSAAAAVADG